MSFNIDIKIKEWRNNMAKIQVILLEDVAGQGRKGDIVSVADGYAHNFLIKNKKGVLATPDELAKIEKG